MRKPFKSHHQRHLPSIAVASLVVFQFSSCQTLPLNSCFELLNDAARDWRYRNIHNYNHNNQDSVEEDLFLEPSTLKLGVGGGGVTCILPPLASPEAENTDNHQQMAQEYSSKYPELAIYCERRHHIVKNKHNRLRRRMEHESKEGGMSEPAAIHLNPQAPVKRGGSGRNGAPARDLYIGWSRSSGGSGSAAQQFKPPLLPVHGGGGSRSRGSSFSGSRKDLPSPISLSDLKSRSSSSSLPSGEVLKSPIYCSPFGFDPLSSPWSPGTASIYMRSPGPREVMPDSAVRGAMSAYEAGDVATGRRASVSAAASILCPPLLIANAFVANYCKSPGGLSSLRSPGSSRPRSFTGSTPRLVSTDNFADRSKWMARFHEFNIFQIYIPGTHNSGAYMVDVRDESQRDNWQERQLVKVRIKISPLTLQFESNLLNLYKPSYFNQLRLFPTGSLAKNCQSSSNLRRE